MNIIFFVGSVVLVLNQYKKPEEKETSTVTTSEKELDDFIVETDECSSTESDEKRSIFKKPVKKSTKPKSNYKRIVAPVSSSESDKNDGDGDSKKGETGETGDVLSSDDPDLYGKDLQLFYIRMNNREQEENPTLKFEFLENY